MISNSFEIITTLGPSSDSSSIIKELKEAGATCFRVNLSHTPPEHLDYYLDQCETSGVLASLDTQGGQLRISSIPKKGNYLSGDILTISREGGPLDDQEYDFTLNHGEFIDEISIGDVLKVGFDGLTAKVIEVSTTNYFLRAEVLSQGGISINKAIDISNKYIQLSPLTNADKRAFLACKNRKIDTVFISFCNSADDVNLVKNEININSSLEFRSIRFIAKIETRNGVVNLPQICDEVDGILIDRGDLSREVSISEVPIIVDEIIGYCRIRSKPVYVATNILDCMMVASLPSRSEISDIHHLINNGVSGLVLAAEVAIGKNPIDSTRVLNYLHKHYLRRKSEWKCCFFPSRDESKLGLSLPPHIQEWL